MVSLDQFLVKAELYRDNLRPYGHLGEIPGSIGTAVENRRHSEANKTGGAGTTNPFVSHSNPIFSEQELSHTVDQC